MLYTFTKKERLNSKKNISFLFEQRSSFFSYPFKIYYHFHSESPKESTAKVLFSIGKKQFKHAVDRNHIKRLCREAYRLNKHILYDKLGEKELSVELAFVFVGKTLPDFHELQAKIQKALVHITLLENNDPIKAQ